MHFVAVSGFPLFKPGTRLLADILSAVDQGHVTLLALFDVGADTAEFV